MCIPFGIGAAKSTVSLNPELARLGVATSVTGCERSAAAAVHAAEQPITTRRIPKERVTEAMIFIASSLVKLMSTLFQGGPPTIAS
jgi:hypothetical protein